MDGITKSVQQQILRFNTGTIFSIKEIHRFGISIKEVYQAVYRLNKQGTTHDQIGICQGNISSHS